MTAPVSRFRYLDPNQPLAIAHRGGSREFPENTIEAFEGALSLGYRYLETDVHVTSDGVLVAFHDDQLDRVTDRSGLIADLPWSQVSTVRVDGRHRIPRLDELLGSFPDALFNIDPKADASVHALAGVITRADAVDRVGIGAFSDRRLRRLRELLGPELCTSMGPRAIARLSAAGRAGTRVRSDAGCVQVPTTYRGRPLVTERFISAAHRSGLHVHVWTIDDPAEMERLLDLGVNGLFTDRPGILRTVLEARGQWIG
jgi:glycerophosphoryl diester phosphodiesterase